MSSVGENEYDGVARSVTLNVTPRPRPLVLFGNNAAMAALSDQNRGFLRDAAQATIDVKTVDDHAHEAEDVDISVAAASSPSPGQRGPARRLSEARTNPSTGGCGRTRQRPASWTASRRSLTHTGRPSDRWPAECPAATTGATVQPEVTPIDGTYTVNTTAADLEASGIPPGTAIAENWGAAVFVFDRGRFASTSHNDQACAWAYGHYAVNGDTVIWDFEGGGGKAPNNATNKPGEEFGFNWSLYRDVLTLTKKEGMISPMTDSAGWRFQQVSTTPDASALNQQCPPPAEASGSDACALMASPAGKVATTVVPSPGRRGW